MCRTVGDSLFSCPFGCAVVKAKAAPYCIFPSTRDACRAEAAVSQFETGLLDNFPNKGVIHTFFEPAFDDARSAVERRNVDVWEPGLVP